VMKELIEASALRQEKLIVFLVIVLVQLVIVKVQTNVLNVKKDTLLALLQSKTELNAKIVLQDSLGT